jgi:D-glycero-D-manno-heptose 1,7-bisphosphate phosphatase
MMQKAVFLDKDGTLIVDRPFNIDPDLVTLEKGVIEGLLKLQQQGYQLLVVSNQPGIAMGLFTAEAFEVFSRRFVAMLGASGVQLNQIYFCPHLPDEQLIESIRCNCRKPRPGLLLKAAADYDIDLSQSWMIGDILNDVEAGSLAGCKTVLINNGNETEWLLSNARTPTYIAQDFLSASNFITDQLKP